MTDTELNQKIDDFWEGKHLDITFLDHVPAILAVEDPELRYELCYSVINHIIDDIILRYSIYTPEIIKSLSRQISALEQLNIQNYEYFEAVTDFFKGNNKECLKKIKKYLTEINFNDEDKMNDVFFANTFLIFKNGFPGFWDTVKEMIQKLSHENGIIELLEATQVYYCSDLVEEHAIACEKALLVNPNMSLIMEYKAFTHIALKQWRNAIACFESLNDNHWITTFPTYYFYLGWSYYKIRNYTDAITAYENCISYDPYYPYAKNNLAYAYYITKNYSKAVELYKECIDEKLDLDLVCDGYAKALAANGETDKAREFAASHKLRPSTVKLLASVKPSSVPENNDDTEFTAQKKQENIKKFEGQFSLEKLLEDELEQRLINGSDIFGTPLKVYQRKGVYGRQFIVPVGRVDLLAEDNEGNLYVIELKKDSGYDDAFEQVKRYIKWFEKSKYAKGKKVYGIICLNNPTKKLIDAVKTDDKISLFEYNISFTEIK